MHPVFTVTDRDKGWAELKRTFESLKEGSSYVKIGMVGATAGKVEHEEEGEGGEPLTNVLLMLFHEFGTSTLPERSVIRSVFDQHREENVALLAKLVKGIYEGRTNAAKVLNILGHRIKWQMKNFIRENKVTPPDSPATLQRKAGRSYRGAAPGVPVTLLDTARLVAAIDHAVVIQNREQPAQGEKQVGSATIASSEE